MVDIIETIDLSKVYKLKGKKTEINALNKVNLSIKKGEIFGLLGPNGAGKTTLIQILTTITQPTSGYAKVNGYNVAQYPKKVKPMIGLMLGSDMLYYRLTGHDNLKFFCKIYKISNYQEKILKISEEF
ncbi:MAG: ATP-binding cassette domain-containing protein, partial [Promethearchaeota archaeon]